jgi:hypothetical protein
MRRIALSCGLVTLIAFTTTLLRGNDAVDATQPANIADVDALLQRIERLERRVWELEGRPKPAHPWPYPVAPAIPPTSVPLRPDRDDGVFRGPVKIYMHLQRDIPETRTAQQSR